MDRASLPDLDSLDRDALVELVLAHQEKLTSLIVMRSFAASKPTRVAPALLTYWQEVLRSNRSSIW